MKEVLNVMGVEEATRAKNKLFESDVGSFVY